MRSCVFTNEQEAREWAAKLPAALVYQGSTPAHWIAQEIELGQPQEEAQNQTLPGSSASVSAARGRAARTRAKGGSPINVRHDALGHRRRGGQRGWPLG